VFITNGPVLYHRLRSGFAASSRSVHLRCGLYANALTVDKTPAAAMRQRLGRGPRDLYPHCFIGIERKALYPAATGALNTGSGRQGNVEVHGISAELARCR